VGLEGAVDVMDLKFEPSAQEMVDPLLKKHFAVQIYRAMSESIAAEHAARMTAMENATKNAGEMIYKLTLTYNKVRQANITTELIEITSGAEALQS
jgi:F-type H+-transporting ATPase subunit gamma